MQLAQVIGQAISTVKHPSLQGWGLVILQPLTAQGKEDGDPFVAVDSLGAGANDRVIVSSDGAGARQLIGHKTSPVRWMVMGICDR
jgi:ethanolamine utilization protein EutN